MESLEGPMLNISKSYSPENLGCNSPVNLTLNEGRLDCATISKPKPPIAQNLLPLRILVSMGWPSNSCPS